MKSNRFLFIILRFFFLYIGLILAISDMKDGQYDGILWQDVALGVLLLFGHIALSRKIHFAIINKEGIILDSKKTVIWSDISIVSRYFLLYRVTCINNATYFFPVSVLPVPEFGVTIESTDMDQFIRKRTQSSSSL